MKPRVDDFEQRSKHLQGMSDEELNNYFWQLVEKVVAKRQALVLVGIEPEAQPGRQGQHRLAAFPRADVAEDSGNDHDRHKADENQWFHVLHLRHRSCDCRLRQGQSVAVRSAAL